jgi:hypothetical protein
MQSARRLVLCGALLLAPLPTFAQEGTSALPITRSTSAGTETAVAALPDAPVPQRASRDFVRDASESDDSQSAGQSSSSSQQAPAQSSQSEDARRKAQQQQINEQEHQRVLGIIPAFNTSYRGDAVSLTAKEKMALAFRSSVDPITFATAFVVAGLHEGLDDDPGFNWGAEGYFQRSGAAYLDAFDGTMIGNGILPSLLHQDPRYFRLGHGSTKHRLLYSIATTVICKHDNTGKWEPNYSNVAGNIISGAISNLYYPSSNSGIGETIGNGMIVTAEGTVGGVFQEFWPDISRKLFHKDPTHGLDAQARAADQEKKNKEKQPLPPEK